MKILVLSDTHAYLENARAVLARLQGKVLCLSCIAL